jgi:hypothetical protein
MVVVKTWIAGTSPAMTNVKVNHGVARTRTIQQ